MKIHMDNPSDDVRIEILPLIDVIFCILTFFMLAAVTLTRQTAINVDLPRAGSGATQMREMMVVSVDPIGQTFIDQRPVTRDELYQSLLAFQQAKPQGLIVLYASRLSSYNDVVQVLDLLRSVGGDRVALATLPTNPNQPQSPDAFPGGVQPNPADLGIPGLTLPPGTEIPTDPLAPGAAPAPLPGLSPAAPLPGIDPLSPLPPADGTLTAPPSPPASPAPVLP